ncbi:MAG TPA: YggS family pyridoxal phosphate-dependent enzyme [Candidatus Syntrophosphaera sp.]|jgi:pyridoxal phosphate enzyme (YggS family)|nr:YggS family pyridoxal phosphate-dependent enzyme [Candidatus Syntrophosphaera sp.]
MPPIEDNIRRVQDKIAERLDRLGRAADSVTLIAVTKTHPVEAVEAALRAGIAHIGENKVQEALRKIPLLRVPYEGFHFIGHLQSNKINNLLTLKPLLIQSIDSLYIARELNNSLGRKNLTQDILVQVNTTAETTKSGVSFENAAEMVWQIAALPCLRIRGLMTIGLMSIDPERTRPYFSQLRELGEKIEKQGIPGVKMEYLSMGMSDDYLVALEEGSNMLRLGSALFGAREYGGRQ